MLGILLAVDDGLLQVIPGQDPARPNGKSEQWKMWKTSHTSKKVSQEMKKVSVTFFKI